MPYTIQWLLPKRIGFVYAYGTFNGAHLHQMIEDLEEMVDESDEMAHFILDGRSVDKVDLNLADVRLLGMIETSDNRGWVVTVTNSVIVRFFGSVISQIRKAHYRQAVSVEGALAFLVTSDEDLPTQDELINLYQTERDDLEAQA